MSFKVLPSQEVSVRHTSLKPIALTGGHSANEDEIIVDWSSGSAKSNISSNTDKLANKVVRKSRVTLRGQEQVDDLLGKSFTPPTSQPPPLESVKIGSYQSSECK